MLAHLAHAQQQQQQQQGNPFAAVAGAPGFNPGFPSLAHLTSAAGLALPPDLSNLRLPSPGPWGQLGSLPFNTQNPAAASWPGLSNFNNDSNIQRNGNDQHQQDSSSNMPRAPLLPGLPGFPMGPEYTQYLSLLGYPPEVLANATSSAAHQNSQAQAPTSKSGDPLNVLASNFRWPNDANGNASQHTPTSSGDRQAYEQQDVGDSAGD